MNSEAGNRTISPGADWKPATPDGWSDVAYRNYVTTVMSTATALRKAWIELAFIDEVVRVREAALSEISQSLALSGVDYSTGFGMATLVVFLLAGLILLVVTPYPAERTEEPAGA